MAVFAIVLVLVGAVAVYLNLNRQTAQASGTATLTIFTGTVSVQASGASTTQNAKTGDQLHNGDAIFTGPDTKAALNFPGGSITRLDSNTSLIITGIIATASGGWNIKLKQTLGKTWQKVGQLINGSQFSVSTLNQATAEVRGTEFEVIVLHNSDGTFTVRVDNYSGTIAVSVAGGTPVVVAANQSTTIEAGKQPTTPGPIPAADIADSFTIFNKTVDTANGTPTSAQVAAAPLPQGGQFGVAPGAPADGNTDLDFALGWPGSCFTLLVYFPDGTLYDSQNSCTPPVHIVVPRGEAGTWGYQVINTKSDAPELWWVIVSKTTPSTQAPVPFFKVADCSNHSVQAGKTDSWKVRAVSAGGYPTLTATGLPAGGSISDNGKGTATLTFSPAPDATAQDAAFGVVASFAGTQATLACVEHITAGPTNSVISGKVSGGPGAGVVMTLTPGGRTTTSAADGTFAFAGLGYGTYQVTMTVPTGYEAAGTAVEQASVDGTSLAGLVFKLQKAVTPSPTPAPTPTPTPTPQPLKVATPALTNSSVGAPYDPQLSATGGTPPYTWTVHGLPAGVTATTTGEVSGTPTVAGTFAVSVTVSDSATPAHTATSTVSMTVASQPSVTPAPSPTPTDPFIALDPNFGGYADLGAGFSTTVSATGGVGPYTWAMIAGSFPPGVSMSGATISGTPTAGGEFDAVLQATDSYGATSTRWFQIQVSSTIPTFSSTTLPGGILNNFYDATPSIVGGWTCVSGIFGLCPGYTVTITAGSLPGGLSMTSSGNISGTPTAIGISTFTVTATDMAGVSVSQQLQIKIWPSPVSITTASPVNLVAGQAVNMALQATGADGNFTWSYSNLDFTNTISDYGLSLAGNTLTGTPTASGTFQIVVYVYAGTSPGFASATLTFSITPPSPPQITTTALPDGEQGATYSAQLTVTSVSTALTFTNNGSPNGIVPGGMSINGSGAITGAPTGSTSVGGVQDPALWSITVADAQTGLSSTSFIKWNVAPPFFVSPNLNDTVGTPTTSTISISGIFPPFTCSNASNFPPGITLGGAGCPLTGTPTKAGSYPVLFTVTDNAGLVQGPYSTTYTVSNPAPPPPLGASLTNSSPGAMAGVPLVDQYGNTIQASAIGGSGTYGYHVYTNTAGSLSAAPSWLGINSTGTLTGTPSAGTYSLEIVVDDGGQSPNVSLPFTLIVDAAAPTSSSPTWYGDVGQAFSQALPVTGGTAPYRYQQQFCGGGASVRGDVAFVSSLSTGPTPAAPQTGQPLPLYGCNATPAGLYMQQNANYQLTGVIVGTPTTAQVGEIAYNVTDAAGFQTFVDLRILIGDGAPKITASSPSGGVAGAAYTGYSFAATGGIAPYHWSSATTGCTLAAGSTAGVPAGLTVDQFGHLTGAPTTAGTYAFCVSVTDMANASATATVSLPIAAAGSAQPAVKSAAPSSPTPVPSPGPSPSPNPTPTPTLPSPSPSPSGTAAARSSSGSTTTQTSPSPSPSATPGATPSPAATAAATPAPSATVTPMPAPTAAPTATPLPTPAATAAPTPTPTPAATATPAPKPSASPSASPTPA